MKTWQLRSCKILPCVTGTAWVGYTSAALANPTLVAPHLNAVILSALTLVNVAALAVLFWALRRDDLDEIRAQFDQHKPRPRFIAAPPLRAVPDMPAAPVWPHVPQQRHTRVYGEARPPLDRIEEELREITRDMGTQRPEASGDLD